MVSGKHRIYTHFPKDQNCNICKKNKITRAPCRKRTGAAIPRAEKFGDLITADHKVLSEGCESQNSYPYAVVVKDWQLNGFNHFRAKQKLNFEKSLEPTKKPKNHSYSQFTRIWQSLWRHILDSLYDNTSPFRDKWHCWNGGTQIFAERFGSKMVGRFHGILLLSAKCSRSLVWWKTPYGRRFGEPFKGPIIPFGSMIEYHPISTKDQSRIQQFGKKVSPGIFLGYVLYAVRIWKRTFWSQTLRSWKGWTHQKYTQEDSMQKRW